MNPRVPQEAIVGLAIRVAEGWRLTRLYFFRQCAEYAFDGLHDGSPSQVALWTEELQARCGLLAGGHQIAHAEQLMDDRHYLSDEQAELFGRAMLHAMFDERASEGARGYRHCARSHGEDGNFTSPLCERVVGCVIDEQEHASTDSEVAERIAIRAKVGGLIDMFDVVSDAVFASLMKDNDFVESLEADGLTGDVLRDYLRFVSNVNAEGG